MKRPSNLTAPYLKRLSLLEEKADTEAFPFNRLSYLSRIDFSVDFRTRVTFFIGENGSGKSTLLEAIAELCDFPVEGGTQDHLAAQAAQPSNALAAALRPAWLPRVRSGFFLRAESFFNVAGYIDEIGDIENHYGGRQLHAQSHGEALMALLSHRLGDMDRALILMDEPEAALSPSRQMAFLSLLREWDRRQTVQLIIATHSPIIMCYPGATLYQFDDDGIKETTVEDTEHYRVTRAFLSNPQRYLAQIFDDTE